ncbi:MAG TPA: TetR/AcrR family transcriptional regulator [Clostridia bacterium]|nr:TetR/AcrR family transcriptional regulator [Clostridia bacterium]
MPRKKQNHEIKKKEFTDAARGLFFSKGYAATSIQDILAAVKGGAGLSPSVFYYYFSSKEEIFELCINEYMHHYTQVLINSIEDPELDFQEKFKVVLEYELKAVEDFKKIDTYFERNDHQSNWFNHQIDINTRSALVKPLSRLLSDAVESNFLPVTPLLKDAGTDMLAEMLLWSTFPITHQNRESDGMYHNEKYVRLTPLLFSQILGVQAEILYRSSI